MFLFSISNMVAYRFPTDCKHERQQVIKCHQGNTIRQVQYSNGPRSNKMAPIPINNGAPLKQQYEINQYSCLLYFEK